MSTTMTRDATQDGMTAERGVGKHTPGWHIFSRQGDLCTIGYGTNSEGDGPAEIIGKIDVSAKYRSLVLAAPDLLKSLRETVVWLDCINEDPSSGVLADARAAIAQAQGGAA